jgi:hypothetical protein
MALVAGGQRDHFFWREVIIAGLVGGGLRYLPVLAVEATKIAPSRGDGKGLCPRIKVKKGLLFHGVYIDGTRVSIGDTVKLSLDVKLTTTSSALFRRQNASIRTGAAPNETIFQSLVEISLFDMGICC